LVGIGLVLLCLAPPDLSPTYLAEPFIRSTSTVALRTGREHRLISIRIIRYDMVDSFRCE